jgi:transaldolase
MRFFLDSVRLAEIEEWLPSGVIDGVTTNPSLLRAADLTVHSVEVRRLVEAVAPLPVSLQCESDDPVEVVKLGHELFTLAPNVVVKVPVVSRLGVSLLPAVRELSAAGVPVNVTACVTLPQLLLALPCGPAYISLLLGRAEDHGQDLVPLLPAALATLTTTGRDTRLVIGSVRGAGQLQRLAGVGDLTVTVPASVLSDALRHPASMEVVRQFMVAVEG